MNKQNTVKEPFIHITRRVSIKPVYSILIRLGAIVAALIVSGLMAFLLIEKLSQNPEKIGQYYISLVKGSFSNGEMTWKFFKNTAVLLCISLALTPAFRMRFWNIGAEGQTLMGVFGAISVSFYLGGKIPESLLIVLMFVGALICGAVWGLIPAIFKAFFNTNETLFTLMLNYIATFFVSFFLLKWVPSGNALGILEHGWLPTPIHNYFLIIAVVAIMTVVLFIYLYYSKHGYEINVVGESINTANYIGINVKKVIIRTMLLSGVLCGLAGFLIGAGLDHSITSETVGGRGFTAILVSWLAYFNPLIMALMAGLVVFLEMGAEQISQTFDVQGAIPKVIVGTILFFIIGCEFFINYEIHFRKSHKEEA
ncbi:MAG: ABC transporter permease [Clostridia bacterium]|nr:ABC transporter permease [Clostridia bacterium]